MCTGNEVSAASVAMEDLDADDLILDLEAYNPNHLECVNPLLDLTPGRKHLMSKYITLKEAETSPSLAEYFGVALAFAALGAMIRSVNANRVKNGIKSNSPKLQRMALQAMLRGAMERLQTLAQSARDTEERLTESKEARENERKAWEEEKASLLQKVANADLEIGELKKRREEDAKANEKVVRIYAGQEQGWKSEKKKLRHEIDLLRKDLIRTEVGGLCSPKTSPTRRRCEKCDGSEKYLKELEEKLSEKEFLIMAAIEEARSEEQERNELTTSFAMAKADAAELTEKLAKEVARSTEREAVLAEITEKQKETESRLASVIVELETTKEELVSSNLATENHSAMTKKLLCELEKLKQDAEDKDEMLSTMLERATAEREQKEDLARELAEAQAKKQNTKVEIDRWKGVTEERARLTVIGTNRKRSGHQSLGNMTEFEKIAELQKAHAEELKNLRSAYTRQIGELENQVRVYRGKVHEAPTASAPTCWTSDSQEPLKDPAVKEWFEVAKGRYAAQLEEKHWHQIETFERQLRAKDERLSVFRLKLLALESELTQSKLEIEVLNRKASDMDERCTTLVPYADKDQELQLGKKFASDPGYVESEVLEPQNLVEILHTELANAKKRLEEQEAEHKADLANMTEDAESELEQKDVQLAVVEAKLCQVQLQLEKAKRAACEVASSDNCQENMFLKNIGETQEPPLKKELYPAGYVFAKLASKISEAPTQIDLEDEQQTSLEELVQHDSLSQSGRQLSKLKDMCLKEEKSTAMVLFHRNLDLETCDDLLLSPDHCSFPALQKTSDKPLQAEKDFTVPTKLLDSVSEDKNVPSLTRNLSRSHKTLNMHKKKRRSMNKQLYSSPDTGSYHSSPEKALDNILFTQAPSKGTRPARFDMLNSLEEHQTQRTLLTEKAGSQATSPIFSGGSAKRKETREDIQVLGLALEVRRIEQQLAHLNKTADAQSLEARPETKVPTASKLESKRHPGLAQRVSQLAKQIGLKSTEPSVETNPYSEVKEASTPSAFQTDLCLHKNPLFSQEPSTTEFALLQQRAETVSQNLAAIQAKLLRESCPDSLQRHNTSASLFPKGQLVDTVRVHLSQVRKTLGIKLAQTASELGASPPSQRLTQVHSRAYRRGSLWQAGLQTLKT